MEILWIVSRNRLHGKRFEDVVVRNRKLSCFLAVDKDAVTALDGKGDVFQTFITYRITRSDVLFSGLNDETGRRDQVVAVIKDINYLIADTMTS